MNAIDFSSIHEDYEHNLEDNDFSEVNKVFKKPARGIIAKIKFEIDHNSPDSLVHDPPKSLDNFANKVRSKLFPKSLKVVTYNFPQVIPKFTPYTQDLLDVFLCICTSIKCPESFLLWMTRYLFPVDWNPPGQKKEDAHPICFTKVVIDDNTEHDHFAIAYHGRIEIVPSRKTEESDVFNYKTLSCQKDTLKITATGDDPDNILEFSVADEKAYKVWECISTEKFFPYELCFRYLNSKDLPDAIYIFLYKCLCADNQFILKTLLDQRTSYDSPDIYNALINIYGYQSRMTSLIATSLAVAFEYDDDFHHVRQIFNILASQYSSEYYKTFGKRLIAYLESKAFDLDSEKVFFTVVKYIIASVNDIPKQLSLFISFICKYSDIKHNDTCQTATLINSILYEGLYQPLFTNPSAFYSGIESDDQQQLNKGNSLLSKLFKGERLGIKSFDKRIDLHTKSQLRIFAYSAASCHEHPNFKQCNSDQLKSSLDVVLSTIPEIDFVSIFYDISDETKHHSSMLSWNFASVISDFFVHWTDKTLPTEKLSTSILPIPIDVEMPPSIEFDNDAEVYIPHLAPRMADALPTDGLPDLIEADHIAKSASLANVPLPIPGEVISPFTENTDEAPSKTVNTEKEEEVNGDEAKGQKRKSKRKGKNK